MTDYVLIDSRASTLDVATIPGDRKSLVGEELLVDGSKSVQHPISELRLRASRLRDRREQNLRTDQVDLFAGSKVHILFGGNL